jgi:hypothetical protein
MSQSLLIPCFYTIQSRLAELRWLQICVAGNQTDPGTLGPKIFNLVGPFSKGCQFYTHEPGHNEDQAKL